MHKHFWILDKNNFGVCKCGDKRQFPKEEIRLKPSDIRNMRQIRRLVVYDPDSWLSGSCDFRLD